MNKILATTIISYSKINERSLCLLFLMFCIALPVFSQQGWEKTYGGTGQDEGYSVQQTSDGGYIVAGMTNSFGGGDVDVYLIKTDANGDTLWTHTYGGVYDDYGYSVQQTSDGGYIIAGTRYYEAGLRNIYMIKTDPNGDTLWTRTYCDPESYCECFSIQETTDNGYILVYTDSWGTGSEGINLLKTNAAGDILWTRNYGWGIYGDLGLAVQQTLDGGYIVTGATTVAGTIDIYLLKTNATGDSLWVHTYPAGLVGWSVQQTSDGGYIVAGYTSNNAFLVKSDSCGDTLWTRTYGVYGYYDISSSVQQTSDGGYIVAGMTEYNTAGSYDLKLIKTDHYGDVIWSHLYGGDSTETNYYATRSVQQTTDGGYIMVGVTRSFGAGYLDVYLIKTDANGNPAVQEKRNQMVRESQGQMPKVVPNPFISSAKVLGHEQEWFTLYDISGRQIGIYRGDRIGEGIQAGVYFLKSDEKNMMPVRVMKIH